jgi:hypothetical protein
VPYVVKRKHEEIPLLDNYTKCPDASFWKLFPSNPLPTECETKIDILGLKNCLEECQKDMTECQILRGKKCLKNLEFGADSCQKIALPPCVTKNAENTTDFGPEITDTIVSWSHKKILAGPFDFPPLKDFRVNPLMAIDQGEKIRPVLNVSLPKDMSFNSNINDFKLEKVSMSTAKMFSFSVHDAGVASLMSKQDMVDAYKNIPCPVSDLRLQGFAWLEKFFVETRQIFGARTAVSNFDILGKTVLDIVNCKLKIPQNMLHRTLDDVPFVSPAHKNLNSEFVSEYKNVCAKCNILLAPDCTKNEKAFSESKEGKVLGIYFNTDLMSWKIDAVKQAKAQRCILDTLNAEILDLKKFQKLMGRLNDIGQMSPFMKGFKSNLNETLSNLHNYSNVKLSYKARNDLYIWSSFVNDCNMWQPIAAPYNGIPIAVKSFTSDAAGHAETLKVKDKIGCGNVGFDYNGNVIFAAQLFWPEKIIQFAKDSKNCRLGDKTTTLEFLGILLPFILIPESLCNQHIIVKVDNIGCYFGWLNRQVAGDKMASVLIRILHLVSAYLGCFVHIEHLPRNSTWDAMLVDRMSRSLSTTDMDKKLLRSFNLPDIPDCLLGWMNDPWEDWELPNQVLSYVMNRV